jgi:hypothetical protein
MTLSGLSLMNAYLLVCGFFSMLGFFADFLCTSVYRESHHGGNFTVERGTILRFLVNGRSLLVNSINPEHCHETT